MGASKQKQLRMEHANDPSPKELAAQKAAAEKKKTNSKYTIGVIVILVVALLAGLVNSSLFDTKLTAAKTGNVNWSLSQVRYAKQNAYSQFYSNYSGLIDYLIDPDTPLDEQTSMFDEDLSWSEYFSEEGLKFLQELAAYHDLAKAEGYTLTEEEKKTIDENMAMFDTYASLYGYTTDGYLTAQYGEGNSAKSVRNMMEMSMLAARYAQDKQDSFADSYSAETLDAWYQEHSAEHNTVSYLTTLISADTDENGNATEEGKKAAKATADKIKAACDGTTEGFSAAVLENTGVEAYESSTTPSGMGEGSDWANDASRKVGDVTVVEEISGSRLYCFLGLDTNDYNTVNVRHILISAVDSDGDGSVSEEEKQAAFDTINSVKEEWDGTEDGFAALAEQYSEDPGSNTNGGLYEDIAKGQMVPAFDAFCFAKHKAGDNEIVYDESYGYFFIYFVGEGDPYQTVLARNALTGEDFTAWKDALLEKYPIEKTGLIKRA